ncbi:hypothetical protein TRIUR3_29145 [Triticum urartu]|uniref:Trichome birefringence-like C-terminal domain-containing protein n=1 Tax=Triticum urartu TaxID=4572 RepID=M7Z5Y7_TRIUA|nr:hypothetical protein TRIUR3_29145 [Triticum urartu]
MEHLLPHEIAKRELEMQEAAEIKERREEELRVVEVKVEKCMSIKEGSTLGRLRNKRLMFVGDSLNRNQWESMVSLVSSAIPAREQRSLAKFMGPNGSLNVFRAAEYNATVEFYWAPFLVSSNSDDPQVHSMADGKNPRAMPDKYTLVDRPVVYKEVLKTWAKWVDWHVDPGRTKVFFMGMSPNHGV